MEKPVKISANLPPAEMENLRKLAKELNLNMTDVLRRALFLEQFLAEERKKGNKIVIEDKRGRRRELVLR